MLTITPFERLKVVLKQMSEMHPVALTSNLREFLRKTFDDTGMICTVKLMTSQC